MTNNTGEWSCPHLQMKKESFLTQESLSRFLFSTDFEAKIYFMLYIMLITHIYKEN